MALTKIGIDAIEGAIGTAQLEDNAVTTGKIAAGAVGTTDLADSAVTLAKTDNLFENTRFTGTGGLRLPYGTTAQRPVSPEDGEFRYNTTLNALEFYSSVSGWTGLESPPVISSVTLPNSQTAVDAGDVIIIQGTNFKSTPTVTFVASGGTVYTSPTVTYSSGVSITAEITSAIPEGSYQLVVTNPSGQLATLNNAFTVDGVPIFSTSAGSLGTFDMGSVVSLSISVLEDSASPTLAITSGALPSGLSLNTSTGAITGTLADVEETTTYNFTITATDAENQTSARSFSITVTYVYAQNNAITFG